MAHRIVKITSYYRDFLSYYYSNHPDIGGDYNNQHRHLMQQRFAWSDAYAVAFEKIGYEAFEIVANAQPLQQQWCVEHGVTLTDEKAIVLAQLEHLQPDIIWLQDSYSFNGRFISEARQRVPSIRLAIGNCCSPITPNYYPDFMAFDLITVCAPYFKELLESNGLPECVVVPHAFDGRILDELAPQQATHDFLFSGSIILDQQFHQERIQLLENLVDDGVNINLLVNLNENSSKGLPLKQAAYLVSKSLDALGLGTINQKVKGLNKVNKLAYFPRSSKVSAALKAQIKAPVFGMEMFAEMARSKIAFNSHGDIAANFAANMRLYEATGIGTCLLTDWKPDINDYFEDGKEVVTYKSLEEAKEKVKWLLDHPDEMAKIGRLGQQKTLTSNCFEARANVIKSAIELKL